MTSTALSLRCIWGANPGSTSHGVLGIHFQDEATVAYAAGHTVVLYNTETKKQRFISGSTDDDGFSALAVCPSKRFLAVAEQAERASVVIFDLRTLRKRKVLSQTVVACSSYSSICFSRDNETVLALAGGGPAVPPMSSSQAAASTPTATSSAVPPATSAPMLIAWRWAKGKVIAQLALPFTGSCSPSYFDCKFSPLDSVLAACGKTGIVFTRVEAEELSTFPPSKIDIDDSEAIMCQCWLKQAEDYCIAGLSSGRILLFQACNYLCRLGAAIGEDRAVLSVCAITNGFVAGSSVGSFHVFLQSTSNIHGSDPASRFDIAHTFGILEASPGEVSTPAVTNDHAATVLQPQRSAPSSIGSPTGGQQIWAMDIRSETEDLLVALTSDKQVFRVLLSDPSKVTSDDVKPLHCAFHGPGVVTGLDVCIRKPLAVTTGLDKSLRVWNYLTHELELCKHFSEDPHSASFHPSGLHVMIGFSDKLRLINLLVDDARVAREIPIKACRECQFSNGGQYFAAVNGSVIAIYEFYTCEKVIDLRGHNSKVRSLYWSKNDHYLVSCGQDGAIYQWDWYDGKRSGEFVQKGTTYHSALCTSGAVFAVGSDRMIKELEIPELGPVKQVDSGVNLSQIALTAGENMMFAATADEGRPGCVRAYSFPLSGDYLEYSCAAEPLTRVRVSHNDTQLVVASEDGCVFVFDIRDKQQRTPNDVTGMQVGLSMAGASSTSSAAVGNAQWSEETLVTKSDLEEKNLAMQELHNKIEELQLHNEYQLRLKEMSYSEKIKEVTEKYMQDLEQEKSRYDSLREEKNDIEIECDERYKQMEDNHHHDVQEVENKYQQRIMAEVEKYQQLENERSTQQQRWEHQRDELLNAHRAYQAELTEDFDQKLEEERHARVQLADEKAELSREFVETKSQLEDDIDTEIQNLRHRYDTQLAAEREATLRYKGENGIMKKKFTVLTKDIEDQKEEIKSLLAREKELQEQIKKLEREIAAQKVEIKKRDDTIGTKEKKIYELKKKNQELEKFKFVLDYKIKELKRQIEPRETEIANTKTQIKTMDHELEQYHKSNAQLDLMIGDLRSKIDTMQKEILERRSQICDRKAVMRHFKSDLHDCAQHIQDPPELAAAVEALYMRHKRKVAGYDELDADVVLEQKRHEESLKHALDALQKKFQTDMAEHSADNMRIMTENMGFIREINKQRETNRLLKLAVQAEEARVTNEIAMRQYKSNNCGIVADAAENVVPGHQLKLENLQRHVEDLERQLRESGIDSFEFLEEVSNNDNDIQDLRPLTGIVEIPSVVADPPAPGAARTIQVGS